MYIYDVSYADVNIERQIETKREREKEDVSISFDK